MPSAQSGHLFCKLELTEYIPGKGQLVRRKMVDKIVQTVMKWQSRGTNTGQFYVNVFRTVIFIGHRYLFRIYLVQK